MSEVHVLLAAIRLAGDQQIYVPLNFYETKQRAEVEERLAQQTAAVMLSGSIIATVDGKPMKVAPVALLLKNLGITGISYTTMSASMQGIIEKPGLIVPKETQH